MKIATLIALIAIQSICVFAQPEPKNAQKTKQQEIGISAQVSNLNNFNFIYRIGKPNSLWRLSLLNLGNTMQIEKIDTLKKTNKKSQVSVALGKEFRKLATEKLEFRFGAEGMFTYSSFKSIDDLNELNLRQSQNFRYGINAVLGVNYLINQHLFIGAEIQPSINHTISVSSTSENIANRKIERSNFNTRLTNQSVLLSLAYRI